MLNKKWITWSLIIVIILLPAPAIIQHLQTFIVRNAVVTAYRYDVHAPIDGVVETCNAQPGSIPGDAPALVLCNRRLPLASINSLEATYHEKQKHHEYLENELSLLKTRLNVSQDNLSKYRTMLQKDLDQTLAIFKARQDGEEARLQEATQNRMRTIRLVKTSVVTQEDADRIEADFCDAKAQLNVTRLELQQIEHRKQMLQQNLFPPDISDSALQVQNRINNLQMKILDCKQRVHASEIDLFSDASRIQALRLDLEHKSSKATIVLPDTAVIWSVDARIGREVIKGERILSYIDRSNLMVDVAMDDATIELINPNHPVRIRLFGSGRFIKGTVIRVQGSAADWPDYRFAAAVKGKSMRDGRVLVKIDDLQLHGDVKKFCGVGRIAYAEFEGIGLFEQYFGTFLR
jgi:multidrug resistance efflux pump